MRLLLTGATGFVARNFLLRVLQDGIYSEIILPVRNPEKLRKQLKEDGVESLPANVRIVKAEAPEWKLENLGVLDHVVHSAGLLFGQTWDEYYQCNVEGTINLLKALPHRPEKIVILSSQAATGPCGPDQVCKTEVDTDLPLTWYGKSKLEMESRLRNEFQGWNYICLRPPMILGARDQATLPLFKMVRGPVYFKPGFKAKYYSFVAVSDLVEAILNALSADWTTLTQRHFFVAAETPITDEELITGAAKAASRRGFLLRIPQPILKGVSRVVDRVPTWRSYVPTLSADRAKEIWPDRWVVSPKNFQKQFNWVSKAKLEATLSETHDWYSKTGQL